MPSETWTILRIREYPITFFRSHKTMKKDFPFSSSMVSFWRNDIKNNDLDSNFKQHPNQSGFLRFLSVFVAVSAFFGQSQSLPIQLVEIPTWALCLVSNCRLGAGKNWNTDHRWSFCRVGWFTLIHKIYALGFMDSVFLIWYYGLSYATVKSWIIVIKILRHSSLKNVYEKKQLTVMRNSIVLGFCFPVKESLNSPLEKYSNGAEFEGAGSLGLSTFGRSVLGRSTLGRKGHYAEVR